VQLTKLLLPCNLAMHDSVAVQVVLAGCHGLLAATMPRTRPRLDPVVICLLFRSQCACAHAQVALGAAQEYLRQLEGIPALSAAGGGQAAADAEYFCNVLSALGVPLPPQLGTWQVGGCVQVLF
jgi:Golgi complex component 7 (COG7)